MTEKTGDREERALQAMFGRLVPPVADDGFSKTVIGRVRGTIWKRRLALLPAIAIGLVISLPAIPGILLMLSNELVELGARSGESEALGQLQVLLKILPFRETVQTASEAMARAGTQIADVSWYLQNQVFILTGLMALVSLLATRALQR